MPFFNLKCLRVVFSLTILSLLFNACSYKNPITKVTNFHSMISDMVDKSAPKIKGNIKLGEVVLVSDFVNLDNLRNKSQLGFLLSNILKDRISSLDIIIKEIELGKEFEFGTNGFTFLTREYEKILSNEVESRYILVGTYSISNKSLNLFIKLIHIDSGNILSSSFARTDLDDEILALEGQDEEKAKLDNLKQIVNKPLVL